MAKWWVILQNRFLYAVDVIRVGSKGRHLRCSKIAGIHVPVCGDTQTDCNLMTQFTVGENKFCKKLRFDVESGIILHSNAPLGAEVSCTHIKRSLTVTFHVRLSTLTVSVWGGWTFQPLGFITEVSVSCKCLERSFLRVTTLIFTLCIHLNLWSTSSVEELIRWGNKQTAKYNKWDHFSGTLSLLWITDFIVKFSLIVHSGMSQTAKNITDC